MKWGDGLSRGLGDAARRSPPRVNTSAVPDGRLAAELQRLMAAIDDTYMRDVSPAEALALANCSPDAAAYNAGAFPLPFSGALVTGIQRRVPRGFQAQRIRCGFGNASADEHRVGLYEVRATGSANVLADIEYVRVFEGPAMQVSDVPTPFPSTWLYDAGAPFELDHTKSYVLVWRPQNSAAVAGHMQFKVPIGLVMMTRLAIGAGATGEPLPERFVPDTQADIYAVMMTVLQTGQATWRY